MTKVIHTKTLPTLFNRDEFLTPFDTIFDDFMNRTHPTFGSDFGIDFFGKGSYPKVNILDFDDKIQLEAEIPGLRKKDLTIEVKEGVLTLAGKKENKANEKPRGYIKRELKRSAFHRSFKLDHTLIADEIEATFADGILYIDIPKVEPKTVEIKTVKIK
jgi:HSP20 family protein